VTAGARDYGSEEDSWGLDTVINRGGGDCIMRSFIICNPRDVYRMTK